MGDRCSVTLSVPTALADQAEAIINKYDGHYTEAEEFDLFTDYQFDDVNYGNLECEKHLTAAGIAWMKSWGRGGGYNAGTSWAMFREDGLLIAEEMSDESPEQTLDPFFRLLDKPEELIKALTAERDRLTSPQWDHQVEYGKRYQAANLIDPPMTNPCADLFP